ncbi:hypothetical protein CEXT_297901 [Caerostris extrusa]|uniref:Uncharacterized protein n=1 Tax=Caerostris extrusa TaxID=172846 RepID=A0AAV4TVR2_CAEEX|nr:hypothetical protein CEXT_297901 [Caerostris extrusa]
MREISMLPASVFPPHTKTRFHFLLQNSSPPQHDEVSSQRLDRPTKEGGRDGHGQIIIPVGDTRRKETKK